MGWGYLRSAERIKPARHPSRDVCHSVQNGPSEKGVVYKPNLITTPQNGASHEIFVFAEIKLITLSSHLNDSLGFDPHLRQIRRAVKSSAMQNKNKNKNSLSILTVK